MKQGTSHVKGAAGMAAAAVAALLLAMPASAGADADLSVDKRDTVDPATVGSQFDYLIDIRNDGPDPAANTTVTDTVPNELEVISATASQGSCAVQNRRVTCNLDQLANGATATVTIRVRANRDGVITNTAEATTSETDPQTADNRDSETTSLVEAGAGRPSCAGHAATIVGTSGDDVITGTEGRDWIVAGAGSDTIRGLDGKDAICAKGGDDLVRAGGDGDLVRAGGGNDEVRGVGGNDSLRGGGGVDSLRGGGGDDALNGGSGDDTCRGGGGRDTKERC